MQNTKKLMGVIVLAVCAAALGLRLAQSPADPSSASVRNAPERTKVGKTARSDPSLRTTSVFEVSNPEAQHVMDRPAHGNAGLSVDDLLVRYLTSTDPKWLAEAQRRFPDNPKVILQSSLEAKAPTSPFLAKMEQQQQDNGLPNLIRAALYVEMGDLSKYTEEMRKVLEKKKLFTNVRARQCELIDLALASGGSAEALAALQRFDDSYVSRLSIVIDQFSRTPGLFGDDFSAASQGIQFAGKIRESAISSLTYALMSERAELAILRKAPADAGYGDTKWSIGERVNELNNQVNYHLEVIGKHTTPLFANPNDRALLLNYLTRVRKDGERAAVNWLIAQKKFASRQ